MNIRTVHNKSNPYFQLNRSAVEDKRLSYKAVGIHTYLMSKPDNWEANETDITARHTDGRSAIRSGIKELIEFGYMVRVQIRKDKKVVEWRLDTYETPDLNPYYTPSEEPKIVTIDMDDEQSETESGNNTKNLECENLDVENHNVASNNTHLESDFLEVENLDVENRTHSNYIDIVNNDKERENDDQSANLNTPQFSTDHTSLSLSAKEEEYMPGLPNPRNNRGNVAAERIEQASRLNVDKKQYTAMVNALLDGCGKKPLADAGDDKVLNRAQDVVLTLMIMDEQFRTVDGIQRIFDSWRTNDYRGDTVPSSEQVKEHASLMVSGRVVCTRKKPATSNGQSTQSVSRKMQVFEWDGKS